MSCDKKQKEDLLDITLNFNGNNLIIHAEFNHNNAEKQMDSLPFLLHPKFKIISIQVENLTSYEFVETNYDPNLWIHLDKPVKAGDDIKVIFDYEIDLSEMNYIDSGWIELNLDRYWYPHYGSMYDKFISNIYIKNLDDSYSFVSYMDSEVKKTADGTYEITNTRPTFEAFLLIGNDMRFWESEKDEIKINFFASTKVSDSLLNSMNTKVFNSIQLYNNSFGTEKPITNYRVVLRNTTQDQIRYQFARNNMMVTGSDFDTYGDLAHEIGHFWWKKEEDHVNDPWLSESFANYTMFLVMEEYEDPETYDRYFSLYKKRAEGLPPVKGNTMFSENSFSVYYIKGFVLLMELEERIGREKMITLLKARIAEKIETTDEFLTLMEKILGKEDRDFFEKLTEN
jgi:hypothetical protein